MTIRSRGSRPPAASSSSTTAPIWRATIRSEWVYTFDPVTYAFDLLSESTLDPQLKTSDCCAVGVTLKNRGGHGEVEERIYLIGGGNDFASPLPYVRYYSIA